MRKVSITGVLIGGIVDIVSSVILGIPFAIYVLFRLDLAQIPQDKIGPAVTSAMHANIPLYICELLVGMCCSVLGGYVAAWLAKHDELLNGTLSPCICVLIGIYSVASGKDSHPIYVQILLLIASPVLGLLGGQLRLMQKRVRMQQPQQ